MHKYIYIFVCTDINMHIHANVRLLNWTVRSSGIEQVNVYACVDVSKGMQGNMMGNCGSLHFHQLTEPMAEY